MEEFSIILKALFCLARKGRLQQDYRKICEDGQRSESFKPRLPIQGHISRSGSLSKWLIIEERRGLLKLQARLSLCTFLQSLANDSFAIRWYGRAREREEKHSLPLSRFPESFFPAFLWWCLSQSQSKSLAGEYEISPISGHKSQRFPGRAFRKRTLREKLFFSLLIENSKIQSDTDFAVFLRKSFYASSGPRYFFSGGN